jgi:hypothetical protein
MDEKGARFSVPAGEEIVEPIGITETCTGVPENRLSLTVMRVYLRVAKQNPV